MLRLIKLARLFGASRVLARLQVRVGTPKMTFTVVSSLFKCFFVSHGSACALGAVTMLAPHPLDTWIATHGYAAPLDYDDPYEGGYEQAGSGMIYMQSLYWAGGYLFGAPVSLRPP